MREGTPYLESLRLRKHALIAESEVNRTKLRQEWREASEGISRFSRQTRKMFSWMSIGSMVAGSLLFLRRHKRHSATGAGTSPLRWIIKAAEMASPILIGLFERATRKREEM